MIILASKVAVACIIEFLNVQYLSSIHQAMEVQEREGKKRHSSPLSTEQYQEQSYCKC